MFSQLTGYLRNSSRSYRFLGILLIILPIAIFSAPYLRYTYTVKYGDTISSIAKHFFISESSILDWNDGIDPNRLIVGQKLKMYYPEGYMYVVQKGDTLSEIAHRFFTDLYSLTLVNGISMNEIIHPGDILFVPKSIMGRFFNKDGKILWPIYGIISSPFGWRIHPITKRRQFHRGIDIAAPTGTPIFAPMDGIVTFAGNMGGYGLTVEISNGSYRFRFGHLSRIDVYIGQKVKQGELIGRVGSTGRSTGPHLHFEVHYMNKVMNPLDFLPPTPFKFASTGSKIGAGGN